MNQMSGTWKGEALVPFSGSSFAVLKYFEFKTSDVNQ